MSEIAIRARELTKRFRIPVEHASTLQQRFAHPIATARHHVLFALNGVSFEVPKGQFLGITGPNGCGKSTLLRVLSGIYKPDAGTLRVNGRVSPFLELGVGFKADLSARDNIVLGATVLGLTRRQASERINEVLDFAELQEFADQKLRNFSSGMVVRLAFSVAALADADILLMDEVLAVGDAHFREKCFDVFWYYKRRGRTIILVSHDLQALEQYCDRVVLMDHGRIAADGPAVDTIRQYREAIAAQSEDQSRAQASPSGGGALEVLDVSLLAKDGRPRFAFRTGDPVTVAIDYLLNVDLDAVVGGFILKRADGHVITVADPSKTDFSLGGGTTGTRRTLFFDIPELPLLDGTYVLTVVFVSAEGRVLVQVKDAVTFHVSDIRGRVGELALRGSWRQETREIPQSSRLRTRSAVSTSQADG